MLKNLTTKNFRKLTDNSFDLGPGLQVLRGDNEAGKSTMLEAIGYALVGSDALRGSAEDAVTWGQPVRSLAVTLVLEYEGVDYTINRSPRGAEINYEGGRVTGQKECTRFIERLIGVESGAIERLMFAPQGEIRGALEAGPAKTAELIEKLSNFDIIDRVVDLIQLKLLTGPTTTAEDRVARATQALGAARAAVVTPDTDSLKLLAEECDQAMAKAQAAADALRPEYEAAKAAVKEAEEQATRRATLSAQRDRARQARDTHAKQREAALRRAGTAPDPDLVADLKAQLEAAGRAAELSAAFKRLGELQAAYPAVYWEGDAQSLVDEINSYSTRIAEQQAVINSVELDIKDLQRQLQNDTGKCPTCGQDLPNRMAIEQHNAGIRKTLAELNEQLPGLKSTLNEARVDREALLEVQRLAQRYTLAANSLAQYVKVDWNFVPAQLRWEGLAPSDAPADVAAIKDRLGELGKQAEDARNAAAQVDLLASTLAEDDELISALTVSIVHECEKADELPKRRAAFEAIEAQLNQRSNDGVEQRYKRDQALQQIKALTENYEQQLQAVVKSEQDLQRAEAELKQLEFNNLLLKRVRAARPVIADKLWTIVLASASTYFSTMRGTKSVITRRDKEFLVDGKPVESYSGSTLDLLGLAIRLSLTRTFLPTTPFLILDEPAAACDESRALSMLGFLATTGFKQTLMVTHEDASESVASNLITI